MTTGPGPHATPGHQASTASQHLAAIAASLTGHGITSRLTRLGDTPVLTIDAPGTGPDPATIAIDPDTSTGPGLRLDCTCTWTPAPGTTPQATADTITAVLSALRPGTHVNPGHAATPRPGPGVYRPGPPSPAAGPLAPAGDRGERDRPSA